MKKRQIHYGIFVAAGCFLIMIYGMGMTFNLVSLFLSSMVSERGFSQSQISDAMTLQSVVSLLCISGLGRVYAQKSARKVAAICSVVGALGYLLFACDSLWACYLGAALVGVSHGGAALVPVSILVTNWFDQYRGVVLSVCMVGSSVPNVLFSRMISVMLTRWGLAVTCLIHAGMILLLCAAAYLLIRDDPREMGLLPFGQTQPGGTALGQATALSQPQNDRNGFILLSVAMFLVGFVITPLNSFYPTFLRSMGYETLFLGTASIFFGAAMIVSKFLVGIVIDWLGIRVATVILYVLPAVAVGSALLVGDNPASALAFAFLWGFGNPIGTVPLPIWVMNLFGPGQYKLRFSQVLTVFTLGSTCGYFLIGKIADRMHSYHPVFWINLAFLSLSFALVMLLQPKRQQKKVSC